MKWSGLNRNSRGKSGRRRNSLSASRHHPPSSWSSRHPPEFDEAEITRRKDGAAPGHAGRGWKEPGGPAPEVEDLEAPDACPCCAGPAGRLKAALDLYAQDQNTNLHSATFKGLMPTAPTQ